MFNNFVSLEKSLDFIESLENKKFAEDEKMKLLKKMNEMQKHIENLESSLISKNEFISQILVKHDRHGHDKKRSHQRRDSNFSNTRIMDDKNVDLYNIHEFGYGENNEEFYSNQFGSSDKNSSEMHKRK